MKWVFTFLLLMLLTTFGCENEDDVLPMPPASEEGPVPVKPVEKPEEEKPPVNLQEDVYHYGSFMGMPYRILFPRHYDSLKSYPLHLFLHGIGERGSDNEKQLSVGASFYQADSIRNLYPAFVVYPQCPGNDYWFSHYMTKTLKAFIDTLTSHYLIVEEKISIGGFSMGAFGTFSMVARNPGFFESAVAISGDGDESKAILMAKTRWQIFAGKKDHIVPPSKTEKMAQALKKAGASVSFTLFPEADHGATWWFAFSEPDFFYKLFSIQTDPLEKIRK
jgi:predicted peptidase